MFPCSADHEKDWQPYPADPYSAICDDHTYIYTIQYLLFLTLQGKETNFRGHKLTRNKVQKTKTKKNRESPNTYEKNMYSNRFLQITSSEKQEAG